MNRLSSNLSNAGEDVDQVSSPAPIVQKSLALPLLCQDLRPDRHYNILDLGPALQENINFFSVYAGKIYIEDFYYTLNSREPSMAEANVGNITDCLLTYKDDTRFDLIFVWDLFNYLKHEPLHKLMLYLSTFCKPGTILFALISTRAKVQRQPLEFKIVDHEHLRYSMSYTEECAHPRYREPNLLRIMPRFKVHKSFLLRNGMQEYLFIHQ